MCARTGAVYGKDNRAHAPESARERPNQLPPPSPPSLLRARHKAACKTAAQAAERLAKQKRAWEAAAKAAKRREGKLGGGEKGAPADDTCVICLGPVVAPVRLPCFHSYCSGCLAELRSAHVAQTCPLCRTELPDGLDGLYDMAIRT